LEGKIYTEAVWRIILVKKKVLFRKVNICNSLQCATRDLLKILSEGSGLVLKIMKLKEMKEGEITKQKYSSGLRNHEAEVQQWTEKSRSRSTAVD
jgi:hypothetical protein